MYYPMREAKFIDGWMDMEPDLPTPKTDWIKEKVLDIPYGEDEKQRMDLYYPNDVPKGKLPLLVIIHGGGFEYMDKADWHLYPGFFALREGFAVISVNYRLAPKNKFPAGLEDVKQAVRFIHTHAKEYGIDERNIFLEGTSAGGNLGAITAFQAAQEQEEVGVNSLLLFCPAIDFHTYLGDAKGLCMKFMYHRLVHQYFHTGALRKKELVDASITPYISNKVPPVYLMQGTKDIGVPCKSAERLYHQLKEATGYGDENLVLKILEGYGHAGADRAFFEEDNLMPAIEFLKAHLR